MFDAAASSLREGQAAGAKASTVLKAPHGVDSGSLRQGGTFPVANNRNCRVEYDRYA